ncbi:hypothetical protein SAMN05661093_10765 [Kibdelosporangium aridum]|uniref:Uncharacterized protein n=1 Tax=Kibdelosporangium aridum TaxID=2030 RepID=A0A1Y5Y8G7_KIBAR|nr:hypothetical protein SAMN05661093_10765 [Kibdelosporangium aridum]
MKATHPLAETPPRAPARQPLRGPRARPTSAAACAARLTVSTSTPRPARPAGPRRARTSGPTMTLMLASTLVFAMTTPGVYCRSEVRFGRGRMVFPASDWRVITHRPHPSRHPQHTIGWLLAAQHPAISGSLVRCRVIRRETESGLDVHDQLSLPRRSVLCGRAWSDDSQGSGLRLSGKAHSLDGVEWPLTRLRQLLRFCCPG